MTGRRERPLPWWLQRARGPAYTCFQTANIQGCESIAFSCFKPPRLWYFVRNWYCALGVYLLAERRARQYSEDIGGSWATEDAGAKCLGWGFYTYGGPFLLGLLRKAEPLEEIFNQGFITGIWPLRLEKLAKQSLRLFRVWFRTLNSVGEALRRKAGPEGRDAKIDWNLQGECLSKGPTWQNRLRSPHFIAGSSHDSSYLLLKPRILLPRETWRLHQICSN